MPASTMTARWSGRKWSVISWWEEPVVGWCPFPYKSTASLYVIRWRARNQFNSPKRGVTWSYFLVANISRAAAFITDCSLSQRRSGMPASVAFPESSQSRTNATTNDWKTDRKIERLVLGSCLNTSKQLETVLATWVFIDASESRYMPRWRTETTGGTSSSPILTVGCGIWCCRVLEAHHSTSVLAVISCRRLLQSIVRHHLHIQWSVATVDVLRRRFLYRRHEGVGGVRAARSDEVDQQILL